MRHLSRIVAVPIGTNILGLLEFLALVAGLAGVIQLSYFIPKVIGMVVFAAGGIAVALFDVLWRLRQPEESRFVRLFSIFTGGCFGFLPIWLWIVALPIVLPILILLKHS